MTRRLPSTGWTSGRRFGHAARAWYAPSSRAWVLRGIRRQRRRRGWRSLLTRMPTALRRGAPSASRACPRRCSRSVLAAFWPGEGSTGRRSAASSNGSVRHEVAFELPRRDADAVVVPLGAFGLEEPLGDVGAQGLLDDLVAGELVEGLLEGARQHAHTL